jgi:hypothetical protein
MLGSLFAQNTTPPTTTPATFYDSKEAFNPQFYPYPGNDFRSASGEPGPRYWQNRADYKIEATLDTSTHGVKGSVEITYINNSPDNLKFLWLQLDQNIYKKDSRASRQQRSRVEDGPMQNSPMGMSSNPFRRNTTAKPSLRNIL